MSPECLICAKHRGEGPLVGPLVWSDEHAYVYHAPVPVGETAVLGYLFIETRRHVPHVDGLMDDEAAAVGRLVSRAARGLREELGAAYVFSAIVGTGVAHFHQHLFPCPPDAPRALPWHQVDEWEGTPRGGAAKVEALCERLQIHLATSMPPAASMPDIASG
jgi:diadenosine tetraphosphate (Ap4A) HIT family hydrolase